MNWKMLWNIIKNIPVGRYWREALLVLCAIVIAFFWMQLRAAHLQKRIDDQNVAALADTVRTVRNRAGETEQARLVLVADADKLSGLNAALAAELKKEQGKVAYLSKLAVLIRYPSIKIPTTVTIDTADPLKRPIYSWAHSEQGDGWARYLAGRSRYDSTEITQDSVSFHIVSGLQWTKEGRLQLYARSSWPAITFTGLDGVLLDEKMFLKADTRTWWQRNRGTIFGVGAGLAAGFIGAGVLFHH